MHNLYKQVNFLQSPHSMKIVFFLGAGKYITICYIFYYVHYVLKKRKTVSFVKELSIFLLT